MTRRGPLPELSGVSSPRMVVSDLDGTLLRSDGTVSDRTVGAVESLQGAGVLWMIATARPPRWLHALTRVVGEGGVAICSNGAFVYDVGRREIVASTPLTVAAVRAVAAALRQVVPDIVFAVERSDGFAREPDFVDVHREPDTRRVAPMEGLLDLPPAKLLARSPSMEPAAFLTTVTEVVADTAVVAYSGASGLAEISASGVTKAAVLEAWCDDRGLEPGDVWACGDMPNDAAMLTWAGTSFAVSNAHPVVLDLADRVIPSNDEDGVAQLLEYVVESATSSPAASITAAE